VTPKLACDYLAEAGYRAKLIAEDEGATCIESGVSGLSFRIIFYRSEPYDGNLDEYDYLMFSFGLSIEGKPDLEKLNIANSASTPLKAYFEEESIWVEMGVFAPDEGLPAGVFEEIFKGWVSLLPDFVQELN
jgi:Putative bacterial sensory transduction regulator